MSPSRRTSSRSSVRSGLFAWQAAARNEEKSCRPSRVCAALCIASASSVGGNVPDAAGEQGRAGAAVQDAVAIGAADRREAGVPALRRAARPAARPPDAASCDSSVRRAPGAPEACPADRAARPAPRRARRRRCGRRRCWRPARRGSVSTAAVSSTCLHRQAAGLALPADERGAVVLQQQSPAGHARSGVSDGGHAEGG